MRLSGVESVFQFDPSIKRARRARVRLTCVFDGEFSLKYLIVKRNKGLLIRETQIARKVARVRPTFRKVGDPLVLSFPDPKNRAKNSGEGK